MDHAQGERGLTGKRVDIFSVKDLCERRQLLWREVEGVGAETTARQLEELFTREGMPLVIKADQGSAFNSHELNEFLGKRGIFLLLSPAYWPKYNGAIESSIRWLKCRTRHQSERRGAGGKDWSAAAIEEAKDLTNELYSEKPAAGAVPPEVSDELRNAFQRRVLETMEEARRGACYYDPETWSKVERKIKRYAIKRALVAHGILMVRRTVIPLPKKFIFAAKIS